MSVINKMLQDLDKRIGRPGGESLQGDAIRSVKPRSPWRLRRNTVFPLLGLAVVTVAGAWWLQQRDRGVEASRVIVPAPPVPVVAKTPPPAAPAVPSVPEVAVAGSTESATVAAPQQASVSASAAAGPAPDAAVPPKLVASAAPPPMASASAASAPDKVETPRPSRSAVASAKAESGKTYSPAQLSANLFSEAVLLDQQGRQQEAKAPLQRLLAANPLDLKAREMLIQLQLDTGQVEQARSLLAEGRLLFPEQTSFTLALARLEVESGDANRAIHLLETDHSSAREEPQFQAFLAALLLRVERYDEAVQHYLVALRSDPANASWLVGVGVALEGLGKRVDAAEAYRRADGSANLTPEMAAFLTERLARLGP